MPILVLSSLTLDYLIKYSKSRKTIGISVDKKNGLTISAPEDTSINEIESMLKSKQEWILNNINGFKEVLPSPKPKEFVSGERLHYIGRTYRLGIIRTNSNKVNFRFYQGKFEVTIPDDGKDYSEKIKQKAIKWYREKALEKISSRVDFYKSKIGKSPIDVRIKQFNA